MAAATMFGVVHGAAARDNNGAQNFFSQILSSFGGGGAQSHSAALSGADDITAPMDQPGEATGRPLTVRMHRRPKSVAAQGPSKPEKVSIFEDRTLRPGDAVMTAKGIRIFAGSNSWPYRPDDFVDLSDARRMDGRIHKVLADLDRLPHS